MRKISFAQALNEALAQELERDPKVLLMGQDIADFGGIFGVTQGLLKKFGAHRVKDTPLSETAIIGGAVGAAITGFVRPVCELMLADFAAVCYDEIYNKAGKWMYMHGDNMPVPMVIRLPSGSKGGGGSEHSQCVEALFMHGAGLKIVAPSTPFDAKGLLKSAIRDDNPVLFMEHKLLYSQIGEVPEEDYLIPLGEANVVREGRDLSIISYSHMLYHCLEAADELSREGVEAEVIDLRSLLPWDQDCVFQSVRKTNRALVAHEDHRRMGIGAEISSCVHEECFEELKAPVARVGAQDTPIPFSPELEKLCLPGKDHVIKASRKLLSL